MNRTDPRIAAHAAEVLSPVDDAPAPLPLDTPGSVEATVFHPDPSPSLEAVVGASKAGAATPLLDAAYESLQAAEQPPAAPAPARAPEPQAPVIVFPTRTPGERPKQDTALIQADLSTSAVDPGASTQVIRASTDQPAAGPDVASRPGDPSQDWQARLDGLLELARREASREAQTGQPGLWSAREQLLGRLTQADLSLWHTVLEALAEPSLGSPASPEPPAELPPGPAETALPLGIRSLTFCRKVEGFGNFDPLPPQSVRTGQHVGVYWEVEGLNAQFDGTHHRTRLASSLEVLDASEAVVWSTRLEDAEDACRRPRRDYFANTRITLPETIRPGLYRLRLRLTDRNNSEQATSEIDFTIVP